MKLFFFIIEIIIVIESINIKSNIIVLDAFVNLCETFYV